MAKVNVRDRNKNADKKPNWEYRFEAAKIDGKRKHISKAGFRTKKEALEAGNAALAEYNNAGLKFEPTDLSVADYFDYWYKQYVKVNLKYGTQQTYKSILKIWIKPRIGKYRLKSLTPSVLQNMINDLKLEGWSRSHIVAILTTISGALNYAIEPLQFIRDNPARFVKLPTIERQPRERNILSDESWEVIETTFEDTSYNLMLQIGYHTGLRISETIGLTWDDIDFEKNELTVDKQISYRHVENEDKQGLFFGTPKTRKSTRTIRFGKTLADVLKKELHKQKQNEILYGEHYTQYRIKIEKDEKGQNIRRLLPVMKGEKSDLPIARMLNVAENGVLITMFTFRACTNVIHNLIDTPFDYHSLRHTHATKLIENGTNVKTVQLRLGHDTIQTTLKTYVHVTEDMVDDSVEIFEKSIVKKRDEVRSSTK